MDQKKPNRSGLGRGLSALISSPAVSVVPPAPISSQATSQVAPATAAAIATTPTPVVAQTPRTSQPQSLVAAFNAGAGKTLNAAVEPINAPVPAGGVVGNAAMKVAPSPTPSATPSPAQPLTISHPSPTSIAAGLPSLMTPTPDAHSGQVKFVKLSLLFPNPKQPRTEFSQAEINELSDSIKTLGVLQPILVRPGKGERAGSYEIVAGERRWRASSAANLSQVPVIIKDLGDRETLEIALVENIQRANLSPLEEARAYQRLADEFSLSQKEIAERVGKDRATVANLMRLLTLPEVVLEMLKSEQISAGHAKAILTVKEPSAQINLAKKVVAENLSVRSLEAIVSRVVVLPTSKKGSDSAPERSLNAKSDFPEVTDRLRTAMATKVMIRHHESGRGRIEIEYFSEQELDRLVDIMTAERQS